jgi:hypothetical protein
MFSENNELISYHGQVASITDYVIGFKNLF